MHLKCNVTHFEIILTVYDELCCHKIMNDPLTYRHIVQNFVPSPHEVS